MNIITEEEFVEKYKPIVGKSTVFEPESYHLETYGDDLTRVLNHDPSKVWTGYANDELESLDLADLDNPISIIEPGYHLINRMFYVITEIPWDGNDKLSVHDF